MKMVCPYCGNGEFERTTKDVVMMRDDGEEIHDVVFRVISTEYHCMKCKRDLTNVELARAEGW